MAAAALTRREIEVLQLCADGLSDTEIADKLDISPYTVGNHIRRILRKTNSANRARAVAYALSRGLIEGDTAAGGRAESEPSEMGEQGATKGRYRPTVSVLPQGKESQVPPVQATSMRLIGALQQTLRDARAWNEFLLELARAYRSHLPMISWAHLPSHGELSVTHSPTMGEDWIRRYDEQLAPLNPLFGFITGQPGDFFVSLEDLDLPSGFTEHPFYREYLRPLDIHNSVAWTIFPDRSWATTVLLGLSASLGPMRPEERELGILLFAHIRHTVRLLWDAADQHEASARQNAHETARSLAGPGPNVGNGDAGLMLLGRHSQVLLANQKAQRLLQEGEWLSEKDSGLSGPSPRETGHMRRLIDEAARAAERRLYVPPSTLLLRGPPKRAPLPLRMSISPFMAHGSDGNGPAAHARVVVVLSELESY